MYRTRRAQGRLESKSEWNLGFNRRTRTSLLCLYMRVLLCQVSHCKVRLTKINLTAVLISFCLNAIQVIRSHRGSAIPKPSYCLGMLTACFLDTRTTVRVVFAGPCASSYPHVVTRYQKALLNVCDEAKYGMKLCSRYVIKIKVRLHLTVAGQQEKRRCEQFSLDYSD